MQKGQSLLLDENTRILRRTLTINSFCLHYTIKTIAIKEHTSLITSFSI